MKDKKTGVFRVVARKEVPALLKERTVVRIFRKPSENSRVETWSAPVSDEVQKENKQDPKKKKRKPLSANMKRKIRRWSIVGVVTAAVAVTYLSVTLQTYTGIEVVEQIQKAESGNSSYIRYGENFMSCDADGVSLFDVSGNGIWEESIQFQNPMMKVSGDSAAVAEQSGNDIAVFGKEGLRGQIRTTLPIEKMAVSDQGITAVILENGSSPVVRCYDVSGKILVEYQVSVSSNGYPVDLALSPDGTTLLVSYFMIQDSGMDTKLVYYDFGTTHEDGEYQIGSGVYEGQMMPTVFFVSDDQSVAIGDGGFVIYKGADPKEVKKIELKKEIRSIAYNEEYLAFVLADEGSPGYELRLYDDSGEEVITKEFEGDYANIKIDEGQVILFDGENASIFTEGGIHRFEGSVQATIKDLFVLKGMNKYLLMSDKGTQTVRLIK